MNFSLQPSTILRIPVTVRRDPGTLQTIHDNFGGIKGGKRRRVFQLCTAGTAIGDQHVGTALPDGGGRYLTQTPGRGAVLAFIAIAAR